MKLTAAQKRALSEMAGAKNGRTHRNAWPRGQARTAWERMLGRLCEQGLAKDYGYGEWEITDAGREHHRALVAHAEAESARALGNSNEARERGDNEAAERWLDRSTRWLWEANDLRSWGELRAQRRTIP